MRLYDKRSWRRRSRLQLTMHPFCQWCLSRNVLTPASVVHHVERHEGNITKFWMSALISLCKQGHDADAQQPDGSTGEPFDPNVVSEVTRRYRDGPRAASHHPNYSTYASKLAIVEDDIAHHSRSDGPVHRDQSAWAPLNHLIQNGRMRD